MYCRKVENQLRFNADKWLILIMIVNHDLLILVDR